MDRPAHEHDQEPEDYPVAVTPSAEDPPEPGDLVMSEVSIPVSTTPSAPGVMGVIVPEPLVGPDADSPLDQGEEPGGPIPAIALRVLKERRHGQWHVHAGQRQLRTVVGSGDSMLFIIDDGHTHAVVGRYVGSSSEGCDYYLVGRLPLAAVRQLVDQQIEPNDAFANAEELTLCGSVDVPDILSANVFDVARYASAEDIPKAYRIGAPPLELEQDLELDANL